jgi:hypothetical protein
MNPHCLQKVKQCERLVPLEIADYSWLRMKGILQSYPGMDVMQSAPEELLYLGGQTDDVIFHLLDISRSTFR